MHRSIWAFVLVILITITSNAQTSVSYEQIDIYPADGGKQTLLIWVATNPDIQQNALLTIQGSATIWRVTGIFQSGVSTLPTGQTLTVVSDYVK